MIIDAAEYDAFISGHKILMVVDVNGDEMAHGDYTIHVHNYTIAPDGDLYATVRPHVHGQEQADELGGINPLGADADSDIPPPLPPRFWDADETAEPIAQPHRIEGADETAGPNAQPPRTEGADEIAEPNAQPPRIEGADEIAEPSAQPPERPVSPLDPGYERVPTLERPVSPLDAGYERVPSPEVGASAEPRRSGDGAVRIGFGRERIREADSPDWQDGGTPGFGRAQVPEPASLPFSGRERILRQLSDKRGLSRTDVFELHARFVRVSSERRLNRDTPGWKSMVALIGDLLEKAESAGPGWDVSRKLSDPEFLWPLLNILELIKAADNA